MATFVDRYNLEREGDTPRNWTNKNQALLKFEVSSTDVIEGRFSMDVRATISSGPAIAVTELVNPYTDKRVYKGTIFLLNNTEKRQIVTFDGAGLPGDEIAVLRFWDDGFFYYKDGAGTESLGTYPAGSNTYDFEIIHDFEAGTYSFRVTDGGSFNVHASGAVFDNPSSQVKYCGFIVQSSARLTADNIQIGDLPTGFQEGDVQVQVGPYVIGYHMDDTIQDYDILHELNEVSEAWIEVEDNVANLINAGDLMTISIIPWGGTVLEQFFFGMIYDKIVSSSNTIRVSGRDALSTMENLEIDTYFFATLVANQERDIQQGATAADPVYATLVGSYASIHQPLTRVQIAVPHEVKRPTDSEISGLPVTTTTISFLNGYRWAATPFIALHSRWVRIGFEGGETLPQVFTIKIIGSKIDGSPDFNQTLYTKAGNYFSAGYFIVVFLEEEPFRFNVGRKYYLVIGPDNPAVNYDYGFHSYDISGISPKVRTNKGVWRYNSGTSSWEETVPDETGRIQIQYLAWEDTVEGEDWTLQNVGGPRILFDRDLRPPWVYDPSGPYYKNGVRVFYSYGTLDLGVVIASILNDVAMVDYEVPLTTKYIKFADALETNALDFIQELMVLYDWRIRQRHRNEGGGSLDNPPTIVAGPLAGTTPVLTLKHGDDATDMTSQARVVADTLRKTTTDAFTMARLSGKTNDERLLLYVQQIVELQRDLKLLNSHVIPNLSFGMRKQRVLKIRNTNNLEDLKEIAETILEQSGSINWKGNLDVDGASWVIPSEVVNYENSRRSIPATDFRVQAVHYLPHRMILTVKKVSPRLEYMMRDLSIRTERFGTLQPLALSTLQHTFYAWGEQPDSLGTVVAATDHRARLQDSSGNILSVWRHCETVAGPTINGLPSKIISCYFPPDDGPDGAGTATKVRVMQNLDTGPSVLVSLQSFAYHWADNAVTVCVLLYQF